MAKEILGKKSEMLGSVFGEALDRLEKLPDKEYMDWMEKEIFRDGSYYGARDRKEADF